MNYFKLEALAQEIENTRINIRSHNQSDKTFCLVPFTTIILEPDGKVGMCRLKGSEFSIGHINENTIAEIWNGPKAREWRKSFLEGGKGFCSKEISHQHCNLCSENNKLIDDVEFEEIQTRPILKLTANFNGKCNLQCQMCYIWQKPNGLYNEENFWKPARIDIFPFIKEIDMLSGEPFIQSDTYKLIDEVSILNPSCLWNFTTNAHWKLTDKIKSKLNLISIKNIIISLDSLDAQIYHKIRYPGDLSIVLKNVDDLISYNKERQEMGLNPFRLSLNFLTQKDNFTEIESALNYCEKKEISPFISFLYSPLEHSLLNLDEERRFEIAMKLVSLPDHHRHRVMRVLMPLVESLNGINKAQLLTVLKN